MTLRAQRSALVVAFAALYLALPRAAAALGSLTDNETTKLNAAITELKKEARNLRTRGMDQDADQLQTYLDQLDGVTFMKFDNKDAYAGSSVGLIYVSDKFFGVTGGEGAAIDPDTTHRHMLAQGALLLHELIHARYQGKGLAWDEKAPYANEYKYLELFGLDEDFEKGIWDCMKTETDKAFLLRGGYGVSPRYADVPLGGERTITATGGRAESVSWHHSPQSCGATLTEQHVGTGVSQELYTAPQKVGTCYVYAELSDPSVGTGGDRVVGYSLIANRDAEVFITPRRLSMVPGETANFKAELKFAPEGSSNEIVWSVPDGAGKITQDGKYTAPDKPGTYHVRATALSRNVEAIVTVQNITVKIMPTGPWTVTTAHTKDFKVNIENARDKSLRWSLQGCGRLSYEDPGRLDNIFCAQKEPCTAKVMVESVQDPRAKDSVEVEVVPDPKDRPKPKPEEPAKTPGISTVNITEFNLPGLSFTPGFVTISPATQGVVMVMVTAAANPILGMTMPSMQIQLSADRIKGPGTYGVTGDVTKSHSAVLVSGGLSTPKVYGSVSGSLIIKEWSTSSGNRISGSFTATMLDDDTKATGSVKANFSVYVASGNGL